MTGETYTSTYPTKSYKWVKAIQNTRKSWFCKGLTAKLWEPKALKLTPFMETQRREQHKGKEVDKGTKARQKEGGMDIDDLKRVVKQPL
jgi:hypothetical protein